METSNTNTAEAVTESLLDRAVKADKFFTKADPEACYLDPTTVLTFLGGTAFIDACPDGTVRQVTPDRVALGLETLTLKNDIDGIFVRSTPKPNLVHVFFVSGMKSAKAKAKELYERFGRDVVSAAMALAKEADDPTTKPHLKDCPEHLNMGGFRVVSAAYGISLFEMLDVVRTHTGVEIKADPEWDQERIEYAAHVKTCECENCVATVKNQAAMHEHYYGVRVIAPTPEQTSKPAPTVAFTSDELEAATKRSTMHEAPASVN